MKSIMTEMKKPKNGIEQKKLDAFEKILKKYEGNNDECEIKFMEAMEKELTKEQRFRIFELNGACKGTGSDKERKAFANENANLSLAKRIETFNKTFGRNVVLNKDDTISVSFACGHGYYKKVREGKIKSLPPAVQSYFERCAGGRLYEIEKALGIKLNIESVDISPLEKKLDDRVVFHFLILK